MHTKCSWWLVGICPYETVTCVVVDECHRATKKADIVLAIAHMRRAKCQFRVLGLSATPGSNREAIQAPPAGLPDAASQAITPHWTTVWNTLLFQAMGPNRAKVSPGLRRFSAVV